MNNNAPMISPTRYAELFDLHPVTVRIQCARGDIPAVKAGGTRWRIPRAYAETMLQGQQRRQVDDDRPSVDLEAAIDAALIAEATKAALRAVLRAVGPS